ncbi:MAG: AraC family transcriptional regulator [Bacteroidota bacterium]
MKIRLNNNDIKELLIENHYPLDFKTTVDEPVDRTYDMKLLGGRGFYREIYMENIHIGYGDMHLYNHTELQLETDFETVEMHFALNGFTIATNTVTNEVFEFSCNQHNIIYTANFKGKAAYTPRKGTQVFEINLTTSFFKRFLPKKHNIFFQFFSNLEKKNTSFLNKHHSLITPQMYFVIKEILQCKRKGIFKKMFIEAKVIELLMLQLEQLINQNCQTSYSISKKDIEKIYEAKEIISSNLIYPVTLNNIAKQVGTNEFTLKKGFKEIFGTTVYGYWNDLKMEEARKMLIEKQLTVSQVAENIGYKNPQHFTTAFKKKYGILPSKLNNDII